MGVFVVLLFLLHLMIGMSHMYEIMLKVDKNSKYAVTPI